MNGILELLRIIVQNCRINDLISIQSDNQKLVNGLKLIEPQQTTGSLAAYDDLRSEELVQFKQIFCSELEDTIISSEIYPDNLLSPIKNRVDLPNNLYEQLITYYNKVYGEKMDVEQLYVKSDQLRSTLAPRYKKSSYILAKFTQDNESIELYPGMVQFYFEHILRLLTIGERTHKLAYVKWYLPVNDHQIRFYCRAEQDDDRSVNIELWKLNKFYEMSHDNIIPIHNIYSQFIPTNFTIKTNNNNNNSKRKAKTYIIVVPINRKFHL
ncbi:hypothetical protein C1646_760114 [Rhizophagus diaphanus]|nr:hypothetical protein C1646_760114 [Rhizophagus diaphanus] [Rhizophagus sp. MUCL 43196]